MRNKKHEVTTTVAEEYDKFSYLAPEATEIPVQNDGYSGFSDDLPPYICALPEEPVTVGEADENEFQAILEFLEWEYPRDKGEKFAFGIRHYREYRAYCEKQSDPLPEQDVEALVKDINESR